MSKLSLGMIAAIRVAMARKGIDQTRLGEAAGISASYLSNRLNAKLVFTVHDVERIAEALGMAPEELMAAAVDEARRLDK